VNAEGVYRHALLEWACVSPCVPPGGRVRACVAVFVSPKAEKADNWRRHVPQSGDCSGERRQSAAREVHEIIKEKHNSKENNSRPSSPSPSLWNTELVLQMEILMLCLELQQTSLLLEKEGGV